MNTRDPEDTLRDLFGSYKAEWLGERMYELFTEPTYFPELRTPRPCVLVGGRGTGKTTVLRMLSYEGQLALTRSQADAPSKWPFIGLYYRVNTNRVTAFKGEHVPAHDWTRLFAHYFNLELCELVVRFLRWYSEHAEPVALPEEVCSTVAASLHIGPATDIVSLGKALAQSRIAFEAFINNAATSKWPALSLQGAPVDELLSAVGALPQFQGRIFFFLVDEYENFEDYQQRIVNTLLKHCGRTYTFKIGVRELGWRARTTLNANEQLISPSDYVLIDIRATLGSRFATFAESVCNARLRRIPELTTDISTLFPSLTAEAEAVLLGVEDLVAPVRDSLRRELPATKRRAVEETPPLVLHVLKTWASAHGESIKDTFIDYLEHPSTWETRCENYKHAYLFTIRKGKRGYRKFYAGWRVYLQLAAENIRYLLQLVDESLVAHLRAGAPLGAPISFEHQTQAAQEVARKNLTDLEGLSVHGGRLTKLLLGLGRVFQVLTATPEGHLPEPTQFALDNSAPVGSQVSAPLGPQLEELLNAAVMHLALLRYPGNKLQDAAETKDWDYMIHPIFSPFFVFSHRRKRKLLFKASDLLGIVSQTPTPAIRRLLAANGRSSDDELPDQLRLFEAFYGSPS